MPVRLFNGRISRSGASLILLLSLPPCLHAQTLPFLIKTYREAPSPQRRATLQTYAAAHAKDQSGALAKFALGMSAFTEKNYTGAVENLKAAQPRLSKLADYIDYYVAAASIENRDYAGVAQQLESVRAHAVASPLVQKAAVLEAKAYNETGSPGNAIRLLRNYYNDLPQPDGDFVLASAYEAAQDFPNAVAAYQRVYYHYPATEDAARASAALMALREKLGASYPHATPEQMLERGDRWIAAHEYAKAKAEFETLVSQLSGLTQDQARVRVWATEYLRGNHAAAWHGLKALDLAHSEADAERLYYLTECARRLGDDGEMLSYITQLGKHYAQSPWRLKAVVSAGNRFLLLNQPEKYEALYKAGYQTFGADPAAAYCEWKVAWAEYLNRRKDAGDLLRDYVMRYPSGSNVTAALYFLGRLAEGGKDFAGARAYYSKIADLFPNYFYAVLARERLADPKIVAVQPSDKAAQFLSGIAFPEHKSLGVGQEPTPTTKLRIERARLLASAGFPDWAEVELRFAARTDGQPHLLAMELARSAATPHLGLRYMKSMVPNYLMVPFEDAPRQFWQLLFPMPWQSDLMRNAKRQNLDPYIVAALIRQESEFNPAAVSHANAYGLTQILPSTGRQLARRNGVRKFRPTMLFQPATNLQLGATYLRSLLDQWGGKWEQTLASYNAGKTHVNDWSTWASYEDPAEFIETIPFTETRDYVQAVLRNAAMYRKVYGDQVDFNKALEEKTPRASVSKVAPKRKRRGHSVS
jgi:soluble lytic murein transglycosylase